MKRRGLLKSLTGLAALSFVAPLVALCKSAPIYDQTFYAEGWAMATAKEALLKRIGEVNPALELAGPWQTEAVVLTEMRKAEPRLYPTFPMPKNPDWRYWDNYHRTMQQYEGFVDVGSDQNMWRFDRISETELQCFNCGARIVVNREVMRSHGKECNKPRRQL